MNIKIARIDDADAIRELIIEAATDCKAVDFDDHGWKTFVSANNIELTKNRIKNPRYFMLCCWLQNQLVGVITICDDEKIDQLFVKKENRGQGIAKKLWEEFCRVKSVSGKEYWVRSSTMAVPVYESFGFRVEKSDQILNGIKFTQLVKRA